MASLPSIVLVLILFAAIQSNGAFEMVNEAELSAAPHKMRVFFVVWSGQFLSTIGSGLSAFGLGVWVYQTTGSTIKFALISISAVLPAIIISPLAGVLIDRWDRRVTMMLSDAGSALCILAAAVQLIAGNLQPWQIYLVVAGLSVFGTFQWPAYSASVTLLVPKQHLSRAAGMMQMGEAAAQIVAPALGGILVGVIEIKGVLLVDMATFLVALTTLLSVEFPRPPIGRAKDPPRRTLLGDASEGWAFIRSQSALLALLVFFAACNFLTGIMSVLATPLILSVSSAAALGTVLALGGGGMLVGSLIMSVWGGPKPHIKGVLGFTMLLGLCAIVAGIRPLLPMIAVAAFFFYFALPIIYGSSQVIWQTKVVPHLQGRVFAMRGMAGGVSLSFAYVVAGFLADHIFEPSLAVGGPLADSVGSVVGVGPGRGIGLLFVLVGILTVFLAISGYSYKELRMMSDEAL